MRRSPVIGMHPRTYSLRTNSTREVLIVLLTILYLFALVALFFVAAGRHTNRHRPCPRT